MAISRPPSSSIDPELALSFNFSDVSFHFDPSFLGFASFPTASVDLMNLCFFLFCRLFSLTTRGWLGLGFVVWWVFFSYVGWLGLMNCWFCWLILMKRCGSVCSWGWCLRWRCFGWEGTQVCIPSGWAALHPGGLLVSSLLVQFPLILVWCLACQAWNWSLWWKLRLLGNWHFDFGDIQITLINHHVVHFFLISMICCM